MKFSSCYATTISGGHLVVDAHRHDFKIEVRCEGPLQERGDGKGMVVDFRRLANAIDEHVRPRLAGRLLVDSRTGSEDDFDCLSLEQVEPVPFRPTAERIAQWCLEILLMHLEPEDAERLVEVRLYENESCWATCRP